MTERKKASRTITITLSGHLSPGECEMLKLISAQNMRSLSAQVAYMVHKSLEDTE